MTRVLRAQDPSGALKADLSPEWAYVPVPDPQPWPPTHHTFISLSCPGRLAMIVTEYMENGSLDAFLRVCLSPRRERVHVHPHQPHGWGDAHLLSTRGSSFY